MSEQIALLQTDLVDSTRLSEVLGDATMSALWSAHDRVARELLRRWHGQEIDKSDGFLLLFTAVSDAVGYSLDYHRALRELRIALLARVGIHLGPVTIRENPPEEVALGAKPVEVDGLAKPITARVMSLALGGQTLLTTDARAALGPTTARLEGRGHWRLKGLEEPIELFEVGDEQAPFTPPGDSPKAYRVVRFNDLWVPLREIRHSLPAERDSFIGRRAALQELAGRFDAGARLISVLGMGGTGKTRLALRFGRAWLGDFAGGVWFCDLSQAHNVDGIVHAVAGGLNVPLGRADPVAQLGHALAGRGACLVILDNFEQVSRFAEQTVGHWLNRAAEARFIVTSRQTLGIVGEHVLALEPLTLHEGAALFRERAAATGYDFLATPDDEASIDPLVRLLDQLPLAIELAAARVPVMTPRMLLQRMGERFKLLTSGAGRLDRQATLRATLDWSWDLLSLPEKSALAQLSVFEGRITLAAAESTLDLSAFAESPSPLDVVESLVTKSLVRRRSNDRFDLLDSVREYAAERLAASGGRPGDGPEALAKAQMRHGEFFATLGARGATADACADLDNLVAATRRAVARGHVRAALGALEGAWAALLLRGPFRAGIELAETVRAMPGLDPGSAARVDRVAGWALQAGGRVAEAAARFESALAAARAVGDHACEGHVLVHLGDLHINEGRMDQARVELTTALALAGAAADDATLECEARCSLGNLHDHLGNLDEARRHHEAALTAARQAGDRRWEGGCLGNLGLLFANQGKMVEARTNCEAALAVACDLGDRQWEGNTRCNLGLLHHLQGNMSSARAELDAALALAREMGHARLECIVLCNLGMVHEAMREPDRARTHYGSALIVARDLGDRRSQGQILGYLGLLHGRQGRFDEARACLQAGEQLLMAVADRLNLGLLICSRAECEHLAGSVAAARDALAAASVMAQEVGAEPESELGQSLARVRSIIGAAADGLTSPPAPAL